jgi:hypothetical protein
LYLWEWKLFEDSAAKAERGYLQALKEASKLTPVQSKILDLDYVGVSLAVVYGMQLKFDESEKFLRSVIDGSAQQTASPQKTVQPQIVPTLPQCFEHLTSSRHYSYSGTGLTKHIRSKRQINYAAEYCSAEGAF